MLGKNYDIKCKMPHTPIKDCGAVFIGVLILRRVYEGRPSVYRVSVPAGHMTVPIMLLISLEVCFRD